MTRYVLLKAFQVSIVLISLTSCVKNQSARNSTSLPPSFVGSSFEEANAGKDIWGKRFYQMDQNHYCQEGQDVRKVPYRRVIELTNDKRVLDLGDPCQPKSVPLEQLGFLEVSYDGRVMGLYEGLFQYFAEPPQEQSTYLEAWCNRSLVEAGGEVVPMEFFVRPGSQAGMALLSWVMVSEKYSTVLAEDIASTRSQNGGVRIFTATGESPSALSVTLSMDSRKQNLYPGSYRMGNDGSLIEVYCRLSR